MYNRAAVVLFYTPFTSRSRDVESLMLRFRSEGHRVISLSQTSGDGINAFLKEHGIETYAYPIKGKPSIISHLHHLIFFIYFCWRYRVAVVFSHLDSANFVASIGQYFVRAKIYLCRHHINEAALYNFDLSWSYKLTNRLARKIIVVSKHSLNYMVDKENVPSSKLIHINLAYDFSLYKIPSEEEIQRVRREFKAQILLITICRLTRFKRPELSLEVVKKLKSKGLDATLIVLGNGEMKETLDKEALKQGMNQWVFCLGHVNNVMNYLAAADFLLHPSILESSCVVVKEAGLVKRPVIVCQGIGDFDEYIQSGINGFKVDQNNFVDEAVEVIESSYQDRASLDRMADNLHSDIIKLFSIDNIIVRYTEILKSVMR